MAAPVQSQIQSVALQSAVFGLVLACLPRLSNCLPSNFLSQGESAISTTRKILGMVWVAVIAKHLNGIASHVALNSWKGNVWKDDQEIVIVTGGSNGIGAWIVRGFAERGAKVAILDLEDSKTTFGK